MGGILHTEGTGSRDAIEKEAMDVCNIRHRIKSLERSHTGDYRGRIAASTIQRHACRSLVTYGESICAWLVQQDSLYHREG